MTAWPLGAWEGQGSVMARPCPAWGSGSCSRCDSFSASRGWRGLLGRPWEAREGQRWLPGPAPSVLGKSHLHRPLSQARPPWHLECAGPWPGLGTVGGTRLISCPQQLTVKEGGGNEPVEGTCPVTKCLLQGRGSLWGVSGSRRAPLWPGDGPSLRWSGPAIGTPLVAGRTGSTVPQDPLARPPCT